MVIIGFLAVLVLCAFGLLKLARSGAAVQPLDWSLVSRLAVFIGVLRIAALWAGLASLRDSGWVQIPGDLLLLTSLPEIYVVRSTRAEPLLWGTLASLILAVTSVIWSAAIIWVVQRIRATWVRSVD